MLLGYNTNGLQNHRLEDALHLLADHGYRAVALTLDTCHLDPFQVTAREIDATAALLERLGLQPSIETGARYVLDKTHKHEPTLMTRGDDARRRRLDFYERAARIGHDLGAGVLSFWAGVDRSVGDDSRPWLESGVRQACEVVRAAGLRPALEPEPGMAVETVADFEVLCQALTGAGAEPPELCLDVGHLYVTGEGEPGEIIPGAGDRLAQVQLEDMRRGVHEHLVPGRGDVDFGAVFQALAAINYAGPVCFELSRSSHEAPAALAVCQALWNSR